jgi:hypothetical protein
MHLFKINSVDGATLTVCAEDYDEAAALFVTWYLVTHSDSAPDFEVLQRNPAWPEPHQAGLDQLLAAGVAGIATYDAASGWTVTPVRMPEA